MIFRDMGSKSYPLPERYSWPAIFFPFSQMLRVSSFPSCPSCLVPSFNLSVSHDGDEVGQHTESGLAWGAWSLDDGEIVHGVGLKLDGRFALADARQRIISRQYF